MTTDGVSLRDAMLRDAAALRRAGRVGEAIAAYERLLARWPELPESWYNLGFLQRNAQRFEAALASYRQALERGASQPEEIHLNCAVIHADHLRDDEAAERELNAALAINPSYAPALLNLANLLEDRGEREKAAVLYDRALSVDPQLFEALARLANLKVSPQPDDPLIGRVRTAIASASLSGDKASLGFGLGRLLDACGRYDEAFAAYAEANRQSRAGAVANGHIYDRARQERFIDALIDAFPLRTAGILPAGTPASSRPVLRAHAQGAEESRQDAGVPARKMPALQARPPIFICGMFRSGSTLTEQVLASHRDVTAGGELPLLPNIVRSELAPFPDALARMPKERLDGARRRYLDGLARLFPSAKVVTDKRPDNFLYVGLIKAMFPDARIVNTVRNPLDNCLSVFFLHLDQSMSYALDLGDIAHYYQEYRRLSAHWKTLFGDDILDFDYDVFVREPRSSIERLLAFCGLDWDEECMSFHRVRGSVKTASVWQVREPLYDRSSGRWRNYERYLGLLRDKL
jgi:tetratricopeptide (TPR) repeat protein